MKKENIKINVLAFLVCYCSSDCFSMDFSNNQQLVEAGPPSILSPYYVVQADIGGNIIFVQTNPNKRNRRRISLLPTEQKAIKICTSPEKGFVVSNGYIYWNGILIGRIASPKPVGLPASVELFTKGCLETLHEEYIVPNIIKNKSDKKTDHYYVGDPHSRYIIKKIKGRIISYEDIAMYREEYCEDSPLRLRFPLFFSAEQSKGIFEEPRLLENCDCSDLIEETSFVFSEKISGVQLCDLQANDQLEEIYRAIGRNIAILHKNVEDAPMLAAFSYPNLSDRNIFVEVSEFGYTTYLLILDEMQKNEPRETDILKISRHILANARSLLLSDDAPEKENEIGYWLSAARSFLEGYCQCAFNNPSYPVIVGSHFLDFQNEILNAKGNLPVGEKLGEMMDDIFTPFKTQNDPLDNPQHQKIKRLKHGFYL